MESGLVVAQSGDAVNNKVDEITAPDEFELFVGDYLEFTGGPYRTTKGMIYYLDDELMRIRPIGAPHTLVDIPLTVFEDENTEILREPTRLESFIDIISLKEGNLVASYQADGGEGPSFTVQSVNPEEDSVVLEEDGVETRIQFTVDGRVVGIPRDISEFAILRSQDAPPPPPTEEVKENVNVNEDEIELVEQIEEPEEEKDIYIVSESSENIIYVAEEQRNDFIEMERAALPPEKRMNPKVLQRIRRLMENAYQLLQDIIEYEDSKVVDMKPITYATLAKLLQQTEFPLAKPVLNVFKTLYLDHSPAYFDKEKPQEDPTDYKDREVEIQYLQDAVQGGIAYLEREFGASMEIGGIKGQLPKFYTVLQPFYDNYFQVIGALESDEKTPVQSDRDFFRVNPLGTTEPKLLGFNKNLPAGNRTPVTIDNIKQISRSYMRAIKGRLGKYTEGKAKVVGVIEQGDEAEVWLYVLFPFLFLRDLGAIRSGKLAIDVGNGSSRPKTMEMIIEEANGIQDISEKGAILAVDPEGRHAANIELKDWFMGQEIYGNGLGDLLPYLRSMGLDTAEFTPEQQSILLKKIEFYQANLKKYIKEIRAEANKIIQTPEQVRNFSLLSEENQKVFMQTLMNENERMILDAVSEFKLKYPSWANNDVAIFSYVYIKYPDYVLACLSGIPLDIGVERQRVADDRFLRRVHESLLIREKAQQASDVKETNNCDHVKNLSAIRKIENDDQRVQMIMRKLIPIFKGKVENGWIECRICKEHLLCEHEYLMLLEKTHPKERDAVHKQILINFSDGVFNGKYICRVCGQAIQELEYDQNPEFDDEGRMMIGNQPIPEEMQSSLLEELDKLLDIKDEPMTAKPKLAITNEEKQTRYKILDEIATKVGISLPLESFERLMTITDRIITNTVKSQKTYTEEIMAEQEADKREKRPVRKFPTYTEYKNQQTISICAAALFIEIQTANPPVLLKTVITTCGDANISGYPLIQDDTNIGGLSYFSCCVASLVRGEKPWSETIWVKMVSKEGQEKRKASVLRQIMAATQNLLMESDIQMLLEQKREILVKERGVQALTGRYADEIPSDFLPLPIQPTEELMKKASEPLIGDAATGRQQAFAWLLEGYKLAKTNGLYDPANPLSEASCCYSIIKTPMDFWREQTTLPKLDKKEPPMGPRGSVLALQTTVRPAQNLLANPTRELMYRIFLGVCFPRKGVINPRVGLPHEPGYDNKCPYCGFVFPVDPRLPPPTLSYSKDKKVQEEFNKNYTTEVQELYQKEIQALQEAGAIQGAEVDDKEFESLLRATNNHFIISPALPKVVATDMETINKIIAMKTEPFTGFLKIMEGVRDSLSAIPRNGTSADDEQVYRAYGPISGRQTEYADRIIAYINTAYKDPKKTEPLLKAWNKLWEASPQVLGELLRTFLLLPFQRSMIPEYKPFSIIDKNIMKNRKAIYSTIALEERKTLTDYLTSHIDQVAALKNEINGAEIAHKQIIQTKIQQLVDRLAVFIPVYIKVLRANVIPFGSVGLPYIQRAILSGILWEFMNPTAIGGKATLRNLLFICLLKLQDKDENTILTTEEIRKIITDSNESEKVKIINQLDGMSPAQKRAELIMKTLRIGRWARGGKGILTYEEEQNLFEAKDRADRGITDFYGLSAVEKEKRAAEIAELSNGFDTYDADGEEEETSY